MTTNREAIVQSLGTKSYRHKLVSEHLKRNPSVQIRAMREKCGWTQRELGNLADVKQNWISHIESPDYENYNLRTLKKLAVAFDVALVVWYIPFSQFVDRIANLEMQDLAPPGYDDDKALFEPVVAHATRPQILPSEATTPDYQPPLSMDYRGSSVIELQPEPRPSYIIRGQQSTGGERYASQGTARTARAGRPSLGVTP
jgi:transcriptional regulator with XRE-family HTH domain